jgi:hypothetical protein
MLDVEIMVPQDWVVLPTDPLRRRATKAAIDALLAQALPDSLPRDSAEPWRRELRRRLDAAVNEARVRHARSVVLPIGGLNGIPVPGSILLAVIDDLIDVDTDQLLTSMANDAGEAGDLVEIGGITALRIVGSTQDTTGTSGVETPARQITYHLPHPHTTEAWAVLTATVLTDGDLDSERTQALVALFDAVIARTRWIDTTEPDEEAYVTALSTQHPPTHG